MPETETEAETGEPAEGAGPGLSRPVTGDRPADEARRALRAARLAAEGHDHAGAGAGASSGSGAGAGAGGGREAAAGTASVSSAPSDLPVPSERSAPSGPPTPPTPPTPSAAAPAVQAPGVRPRASAPGARPGDAAREALRRATASDAALPASEDAAEAGSGQDLDGTPTEPPASGEPVTTGRSGPRPQGDARPGDIAREALRAARDEARRLRSEGTDGGGERTTESGGKGVGPRRRPDGTSRAGARGRRHPARSDSGERASQERDLRDLLANAFRLPPDVTADTGEQPSDPAGPGQPSHPADGTGETTRDRDSGRIAHPVHPGDAARPERPADAARPAYPVPGSAARAASEPVTGDSPDLDPFTAEVATPEPFTPETSAEFFASSSTGGRHPEPVAHAERSPRSMASPGRDGELRRTFPAFPARGREEGGGFAETWWGNAWVTALEEGALDAARLARGRTYAGHGHVDAVTVTPGLVLAYVHGSRPRPYRVQVRVRTLTDGDWDRFLDAAAERPGHIAALLDKEMPKSLADCGVELLPGPGELEPHCSCPDFGHPCKHAAALCYQTARLLDQDPFVLFLLRGRGERELLDALSRRNATRAARAAQEREPEQPAGVRARDALGRRVLPPLPAPLPPPAHPEQPPAYPGVPGGPDAFALDQLATDAAARAYALLASGRDPVADLTLWQDAVRIAAARPGSGLTAATRALYSSLASATGRTPLDLARAVAAWRQGGFDALAVLEEPWDPPAGRFDRARPLLMAADFPAFRPWRNHLTHPRGHAQLRLGRNGLWYAYESDPGQDDWWPRGTPDLDPVGALTGLGAPGEL
ncbi:SWIM zinc finger family protein [Streptomyces sp. NPDC058398]|uniref:SWIM zinc finger family protein n=1 Tax=Streptomyces sp. NPDC058398 TaxID=3346479 RepID=UPI0036595DFF